MQPGLPWLPHRRLAILTCMSERYYVDQPLALGDVTLHGPEAHHLANVCRIRVGETVVLFNGDGRQYPAVVRQAGKRAVLLEVTAVEAPERELGFRLEVAAPLPKGDRAAFLVEKLTELGVTDFVPLRTARSVVHPRDTDKLTRHVIEASKQCGRNVLMRVAPLTDWADYLADSARPARRLLAHPGAADGPDGGDGRSDRAVVVGPEGGLTDDEVAAALAAGWRLVGLGPRILRVETAALVLAAFCARSVTGPGAAAP